MTLAALAGFGSGAFHAVTGPDHVLSLAPLSARAGSRAWRLGLRWGLGHALGTLAVAVLALAVLQTALLATWGDRLGALALIVTGLAGLRTRATPARAASTATVVGFVHGLAGGAAVIAVLPALLPTTTTSAHVLVYVAAFAIGSTLAMAILTRTLALGGDSARLRGVMARVGPVACAASIVLGAIWLVRAL